MNTLLLQLTGGDRRSIGRANEVAAAVLADPAKLDELFAGLTHGDPLIRMRAADALEKVSSRRPDLIQTYKSALLGAIADTPQAEVRWHVAQMIPRLALSAVEREVAFALLVGYLGDKSSIVRTFALQAIAELASEDRKLQPMAMIFLEQAIVSGTPAMRSRARKLLHAQRGYNRIGSKAL